MDMNALNLTAALKMSRAQSGELPPLPFPAVPSHGLPGFLPPTPVFKPGPAALDWTLYESLVRSETAASISQKPTTDQPIPSTSAPTTDTPLDLSVGSRRLKIANVIPATETSASKSAGSLSHSTSAALDLSKSRLPTRPAISPKSQVTATSSKVSSASYDGRILTSLTKSADSSLGFAALPKIYLNCKRCSFVCNDTVDFQKHFTQAHNSMPSMDDIIVTNSTTRPSSTISHSSFWQQKMPAPKDSVCFHCSHCGWQCDISNPDVFTKHVGEHVNDSGSSYKCFYCKTDYHDPNHLREHIAAHAGVNHYICSFCCIAFSTETMATSHMEQKHGVSVAQVGQSKWSAAHFRMSPHYPFNSGGNGGLLNIKKEATEIVTARVPPSYRSDMIPATKMAAVSPMSRPTADPSPESPRSSDSNSGPSKPLAMKRTGFGQSLAKHIEAAISRELMGNKSPTMSDLMFMKSSGGEEVADEGIRKPAAAPSSSNPLSLMSLLDKVVEESLRNVPIGQKSDKADLKFMVSFSDDEDGEKKGMKKKLSKGMRVAGELSPNSAAKEEAVVSSSETAETSNNTKTAASEVSAETKLTVHETQPANIAPIDSPSVEEGSPAVIGKGQAKQVTGIDSGLPQASSNITTRPEKHAFNDSSSTPPVKNDIDMEPNDEPESKRSKTESDV